MVAIAGGLGQKRYNKSYTVSAAATATENPQASLRVENTSVSPEAELSTLFVATTIILRMPHLIVLL